MNASAGGYIDLLRTLGGALVNLPLREMERLQDQGVHVDFLVPEYDIMKPRAEVRRFYKPGTEKDIYVADRGGHAYPALAPQLFGKQVRELYDRRQNEKKAA